MNTINKPIEQVHMGFAQDIGFAQDSRDVVTIANTKPDTVYKMNFKRDAGTEGFTKIYFANNILVSRNRIGSLGHELNDVLGKLAQNGYDVTEIKIQAPEEFLQATKLVLRTFGVDDTVKSIYFSTFMNEKNYKNNILTMPISAKINALNIFEIDVSEYLTEFNVTITMKIKNTKLYGV